jgi:hypothetical protein
VLPPGQDAYGNDIIAVHARAVGADLIITLMDVWVLNGSLLAGLNVACWIPVDCAPLSAMDRKFLDASGARPVAMSRHGERQLAAAGYQPVYVPHSVDTAVLTPPAGRDTLREQCGLPGRYVIGINAANQDQGGNRKAFYEQMAAFAAVRGPAQPNRRPGVPVRPGELEGRR